MNDANGNEDVKKIVLISKTITLNVQHTFFVNFFADYDVKMPNFTFYAERKQATTKFFSLSELGYGPLEFKFGEFACTFNKVSVKK